mmetsp:Transcript_48404/g.114293  ORF Transcript_48404/g.114293 Transcript_48404/m.114293 type:complete len:89 (-) Transcript_48404:20-286(-)
MYWHRSLLPSAWSLLGKRTTSWVSVLGLSEFFPNTVAVFPTTTNVSQDCGGGFAVENEQPFNITGRVSADDAAKKAGNRTQGSSLLWC